MKHQRHLYFLLFGCLMVMCGFFLPWFSPFPFSEDHSAISAFQIWVGGWPEALQYTRQMAPEFFVLLWLLPLAAFFTCILSLMEMFKPGWDRRWIRLTAYAAFFLTMGLFLWPAIILMAPKTMWGLWLCLAGWLVALFALFPGIFIGKKENSPLVASSFSQQKTRRIFLRGIIGLAGVGSLGLGDFLWTRWARHQQAIFTRHYLNPPDYQVRGLLNMVESWILRVRWSPNSQRLLISQLHIAPQSWDARTGAHVRTYQSSGATVALWSPDGRYIALCDPISGKLSSSSNDLTFLTIINATAGAKEAELNNQTSQLERIAALAWAPDGQSLAVSNWLDPVIKLWNPFTGKMGKTYTIFTSTNSDINRVQDLAWSPDGQYLAAAVTDASLLPNGSRDQELKLTSANVVGIYMWHVQSGEPLLHYSAEISSSPYRGSLLNWSPDGRYVAFANKTTIQVLDVAAQKLVLTYSGHMYDPTSITWSPDGKHIASSSEDWTVQVWDTSTGVLRFLYQGHSSIVSDTAWSPDGRYIASGGFDGTVRVWQPDI